MKYVKKMANISTIGPYLELGPLVKTFIIR